MEGKDAENEIRRSLVALVLVAVVPLLVFGVGVGVAWMIVDRELVSQLAAMEVLATDVSLGTDNLGTFQAKPRRTIEAHGKWRNAVLIDPHSHRIVGVRASPTLANHIAASERGMFTALNQEGATVYTGFSRSPLTGWSVPIGVPAAEVEGPIRRILLWLAAAGGALVACALILTSILGRRIVRRRNAYEQALRDSDERLHMALAAADIATWDWHIPSGALVFNARWAEIQGYSLAELPLRVESWESRVFPDDMPQVREKLDRHFKGETPTYESEHRVRHKDGHWIWVQGRGKVIEWDNAGNPVRVVGTALDITERKQAEEMLRKLSTAVEQSPASVIITDLKARIEYVNPRFSDVTGYSAAEVLGKNPRILQSGQTAEDIYLELWRKLCSGETWRGELLNKDKNGELYWEETHIAPVKNPAGAITHYVAIKNNITERKQIEQALQESERRYHFLFDNNPMPMFVIEESSLKFLVVNDRAVEHYGFSREEFSRMTLRDIRPVEDIPKLYRTISASPDGRLSGEWQHKKKDGTVIDVAVNTVPMQYGAIPARIAIIQDITKRKQAEAMFHGLFDQSSFFAAILDQQGRLVEVNSTALCFTDAPREELIGKYFPDTLSWSNEQDRNKLIDMLNLAYAGNNASVEGAHPLPDGGHINVMFTATPIFLQGSTLVSVVGVDITHRKRAEYALRESESRFRTMADNAPVLIWIAGADKLRNWFNKGWLEFTGRELEQEMGNGWAEGVHPEDFQRCIDTYVAAFEARQKFSMEYRLRRFDGEYRWLVSHGVPRYDDQGTFLGYIGTCIDITDRHLMEDQIRQLAFYDALTKLPNRRLLDDRLKQSLAASHRSGRYGALMFVDLDNFKPLNDKHGHAVGDLLLIEVAERISHCVREVDTVARIGGDEFVVIINGLDEDRASSALEAKRIAEQIRSILSEPYILTLKRDGESESTVTHHCTVSIGVASFIDQKSGSEEILKSADMAMYRAKESGRNRICFYEQALGAGIG